MKPTKAAVTTDMIRENSERALRKLRPICTANTEMTIAGIATPMPAANRSGENRPIVTVAISTTTDMKTPRTR